MVVRCVDKDLVYIHLVVQLELAQSTRRTDCLHTHLSEDTPPHTALPLSIQFTYTGPVNFERIASTANGQSVDDALVPPA